MVSNAASRPYPMAPPPITEIAQAVPTQKRSPSGGERLPAPEPGSDAGAEVGPPCGARTASGIVKGGRSFNQGSWVHALWRSLRRLAVGRQPARERRGRELTRRSSSHFPSRPTAKPLAQPSLAALPAPAGPWSPGDGAPRSLPGSPPPPRTGGRGPRPGCRSGLGSGGLPGSEGSSSSRSSSGRRRPGWNKV